MTTQEVIKICGVCHSAASHWAASNGVEYIGEGRRKTYIWTEEDIERFRQRPPKGRPKSRIPACPNRHNEVY